MADPKWKSLTPIWRDTVVLLANVIGGQLLDGLLSEKLLTHDQYDSLLRKKEGSANEEVARELLQTLKKSPNPSFDNFWAFLNTEIEGGSDIRRQLFERRDMPPSLQKVDHRRTEPDQELDKFSAVPDVEIGGESSRRQQMLLTSATGTAAAEAAAVALQPDQRAVYIDQNAASKLLVIIEVVESLKDKYQLHADAIRAVLRTYLAKAYSKNLDDDFLDLEEIFCKKLSRVKQQEEPAKTLAFETNVQPKIRILFPDSDSAKYEPNHRLIETHLCRVMQLKRSDLEIDVAEGSITLLISIPGRGLINMLVYLNQNSEPLNFLLYVDKSARISFGEFPYVSVSVFGPKSFQETVSNLRKSLFNAIESGDVERVKEWVENGENRNKWKSERGLTVLEWASFKEKEEITRCLVVHGYGREPLLEASSNGHVEIAKLLIDARANVNTTDEIGRGPLLEASSNGHVEIAKLLIDAGVNVNETNWDERGPLLEASSNGHVEIAKLLIDAGANVNKTDWRRGRGPLLEASSNGYLEIAKLLINARANINDTDRNERGPLLEASSNGHVEIATLLIDAGANVNKTDWRRGRGPLLEASSNGYLEIAKLLIDAGANVNNTDWNGRRPLLEASSNGHVEIAKLLIDAGANVNKTDVNGKGPLSEASSNGHVEIAKLLINAGANVNKTGENGKGPLLEASSNGHVEIAKLLIDAGANVNKTDWRRGRGPLLEACSNGHAEIAKLLIDARANANNTDWSGRGSLLEASSNCNVEIVKLLVDAGADVNKTDVSGRGPLWEASSHGHVEIAKLLIDAGANVNKTDRSGRGPLWEASSHGHVEIAKLLIDSGAIVNKTDRSGRGPLWEASSHGHVEIAKLLIDSGAIVNKTDRSGRGPLWEASSHGHVEIAQLLIDAAANVNETDEVMKEYTTYRARGERANTAGFFVIDTGATSGVLVERKERAGVGGAASGLNLRTKLLGKK